MANETRRRRKEQTPATRRQTTLQDIPDHFLKRVILRLDTHLSLVRAAAVCKRWRRIAASPGVADYNFSYRYPGNYVLGYYHAVDESSNNRRAIPPDGSLVLDPDSPAPRHPLVFVPASPAINVRHFSLDFLQDAPGRRRRWELVDGRGSLLLLADQRRGLFPDLVVCEPISRRHVRIRPVKDMKYLRCLGVFLANNAGFSRHVDMSDFKVTCVLYERSPGMADDVGEAVSCFYNRAPRNRQRITGWNTQCVLTSSRVLLHGAESAHYAGRAAGLVFWVVGDEDDGTVLAASIDQSGFRRYRLPEHLWGSSQPGSSFRFVEASVDVYPRVVRLVSLAGDELRVYLGNLHDSSEWQLERTLHMSHVTRGLQGYKDCFFATTAKIVGEGHGYVVMTPAEEETWLFSLDLKTMRVERDHSRNRLPGKVYTYELERPPVVRACVVRCKRIGYGPLWRGLGRCSHICICG